VTSSIVTAAGKRHEKRGSITVSGCHGPITREFTAGGD
jgi:hypothetical protein